MKNAHLRFGWLTYVKSTEKTTTSIKLRLDRFIGEVLPDPPRQAKAHLISVIGGDTHIAAVSAAISLGDRFMVEGPGVQPIRVCLERNPQCFKGSVQLAGRKKPTAPPYRVVGRVRFQQRIGGLRTNPAGKLGKPIHLGRSRPYSRDPRNTGMGGLVCRLNWKRIRRSYVLSASDVLQCWSKGEKEQFLSWLSWGVESGAVSLPAETGSIRWPSLSLEDLFLPAN